MAICAILAAIFRIPGTGDRWEAAGLLVNALGVGLMFVAAIRLLEMFTLKESRAVDGDPATRDLTQQKS